MGKVNTKTVHPVRPETPPAYGRETAQAVLDIIKEFPELHDQDLWESECGTTRCIGGWVWWLHKDMDDVAPFARMALGVSDMDGRRLFHQVATNTSAIRALEYLAHGEQIDWEVVWYGADED